MESAEVTGRGAATRVALLDAAREVFCRNGYEAASITDIVELAGSSVGSLYHHFGGKSDLWLALYDQHQRALQRRTSSIFRAAVSSGARDALELFVIGTRAYLDACWQERKLVRVFAGGDQPAGFGVVSDQQFQHWLRTNVEHLGDRANPLSHTLVLSLTTLARTAGIEVARQSTRAKADRIGDEFLDIMQRLYRR